MNDRFYVRYFNKNTKEFEYHKIGAINTKPYTDCTIYEEGQFCTGLHDKNGRFIYEGDIVRIFHLSSTGQPRTYISEVYYYKVKPSFQVKGYGFIDEDDVVEVIGNIYENKELLEEYKDE